MANVWELITGNSTLPVQAGNTLWDHLNNLGGGGGGLIPVFYQSIQVEEQPPQELEITDQTQPVLIDQAITTIVINETDVIGFEQ